MKKPLKRNKIEMKIKIHEIMGFKTQWDRVSQKKKKEMHCVHTSLGTDGVQVKHVKWQRKPSSRDRGQDREDRDRVTAQMTSDLMVNN